MQRKKVGKADDAFFFIINIQVSRCNLVSALRREFFNIVTSYHHFSSSLSYLTFVCCDMFLDMIGNREVRVTHFDTLYDQLQVPGTTTYSLVLYYMITQPVSDFPLLENFVRGDDHYRNASFKLIPHIAKVVFPYGSIQCQSSLSADVMEFVFL